MSNADPLTKALQRLVAAAGGDARALRVPQCRAPVQVRVQQIGAARIVVVEPRNGTPRATLLDTEGHVWAESQGVHTLLRGVVTPLEDELWLFVQGRGWAVPLLPSNPATQTALVQRIEQPVIVRGVVADAGFYVQQVLGHQEQLHDDDAMSAP